MRLVDCYIESILFARQLVPTLAPKPIESEEFNQDSEPQDTEAKGKEFQEIKARLVAILQDSLDQARDRDFSDEIANAALLPVVAYIDEMILCSDWQFKAEWQKESLQRHFFQTTNIGSEFYESLNELSKHGSDSWVREVYVLCLGLGFKGRYFSNDDRRMLEEIKGFNVSLLLPDEAQRNIETATLFPSAYSSRDHGRAGTFKARLNVIPYVVGIPIVLSVALVVYYHFNVAQVLDQIAKAVN